MATSSGITLTTGSIWLLSQQFHWHLLIFRSIRDFFSWVTFSFDIDLKRVYNFMHHLRRKPALGYRRCDARHRRQDVRHLCVTSLANSLLFSMWGTTQMTRVFHIIHWSHGLSSGECSRQSVSVWLRFLYWVSQISDGWLICLKTCRNS